ncbi:MAG: NAD(P)H-dependent oxidoreductase [Pirellula sp.]|jgi:nitroreductase|nr:NAD(P)H-dependent oxidoreductase [Pirellula sp.]
MSIDYLNWRYAVKRFDPTRRIPGDLWEQIEESLVLTPSSFGLQPWKFVVVTSEEVKAKLPAISWNQNQPAECSHMVLFAANHLIDAAYVDRYISEISKTRGVSIENLTDFRNVMVGFLRNRGSEISGWASNQVYIALGQLLTVAATLGIDACPMEGLLMNEYDRLLGLEGSGFSIVVGCALGYRHPEDRYAQAAKVRFSKSEMVTTI